MAEILVEKANDIFDGGKNILLTIEFTIPEDYKDIFERPFCFKIIKGFARTSAGKPGYTQYGIKYVCKNDLETVRRAAIDLITNTVIKNSELDISIRDVGLYMRHVVKQETFKFKPGEFRPIQNGFITVNLTYKRTNLVES